MDLLNKTFGSVSPSPGYIRPEGTAPLVRWPGGRIYPGLGYHQHKMHSAFTSLEFLLVLSLTALLFLLSYPALNLSASIFKHTQQNETRASKETVIQETIERGINHTQALFSVSAQTIHPSGTILLSNQIPHHVTSGSASLRPDSNSNAVSFLELRPDLLLRVIDRSSTSPQTFIFCHENALITSAARSKLLDTSVFIAVAIDGSAWVKGTLHSVPGHLPLCLEGVQFSGTFAVDEEAHVFHSFVPFHEATAAEITPQSVLNFALIMLPIADAYTLYVDRRGYFRRLSDLVSENQPIVSGVNQLLVGETHISDSSVVVQITVAVIDNSPRLTTLQFTKLTSSPLEVLHLAL